MTKLSKRHRLLGGALLLAGGAWAVDHFTSGGPKRVQAAQAPASSASVAVTPAGPAGLAPENWEDVQALVSRLTDTHYTPVGSALAELERDLFRPTPLIDAAFTGPEMDAAAAGVPDQPPFETRHRLTGVMLGAKPLAIVDGQLLPLRASFDEHVLIELHRDYAVFVHPADGARVRLELDTGGRARATAAPTQDLATPPAPTP